MVWENPMILPIILSSYLLYLNPNLLLLNWLLQEEYILGSKGESPSRSVYSCRLTDSWEAVIAMWGGYCYSKYAA